MASRVALRFSEEDNVATLLEDLATGDEVHVRLGKQSKTVQAREDIPFGFKIALTDIVKGARIVKYGEPIGIASQDIRCGGMVHIHNLEGARGRGDLAKGGAR
jgi:altronate dehydratase small subunit